MTLATTALALYLRTKAHLHHLTKPAPASADHNHPTRPIELAFPVHPTRTPRRLRPQRPLTTAVRHLLRSVSAPLPPAPTPPAAKKPSCRLCVAGTT